MSTINVLSRQELQNSNNADLTPIIETLTTLVEKLHLVPGTHETSIADKVPPKELTIAERLTNVLKKCHHLSNSPADDNVKVAIKREMAFNQSTGQCGKILESLYKALMTIPHTTIDAERTFSASGLLRQDFAPDFVMILLEDSPY